LEVAIRAQEKFPVSNDTVFAAATAGTLKAAQPAPLHKMRPAMHLGSGFLIESSHARTFLKLDRLSTHRSVPPGLNLPEDFDPCKRHSKVRNQVS
jgi:hypothetical protein